ncbi:MAG: GAF domain-containing protein [Chloroflexi bacterium]|nr:GAF domain-containing protein [Chloroflexota bacterium]
MAHWVLTWAQGPLLRLSLHRRIAVFVSTILLAAFLAFGYLGWEAVSRSTAATLQERRATASVVARHIDDLIGHAQGHLVVLASELARESSELEPRQVEGMLEKSLHQLRIFFTHLLVFDPQQRLLASTPLPRPASLDPTVQALLDQAMRSGQPAISNLLRLPAEGSLGVLFVAPIVKEDHVLGVVAAEMWLPHPSISSVAGVLQLGRSGHMEVVDGAMQVLASTSAADVFKPSEHHDFYAPLLAQRVSTVDRALYEEEHEAHQSHEEEREADEAEVWHIMAFVPLEHAPWGVGLGQDEAETFEAPRELRDRALALAAVALAVALCCAWLGTHAVVHPIQTLTRAGERMATGDLSEPIRIVQSDEVGRLAQVLEVMRQRLEQSLAEITAWNRELERRVRERTRELEASNRHLHALMAVAMAASRGTDREEVLSQALQELADTLGARSAWAFLWDEAQQHLRLAAGYGLPEPLRQAELTVAAPEAACMAALRASSVVSEPQSTCPALPAELALLANGTLCWCAPIRLGEQSLGTLCLATTQDRVLEREEIALLGGVAHQVAVAFENSRLTEETTRLEAARRLELLRAEFLASVSHELRTPLGFIKGYTTTLLRNDVTWEPAQQQEFLQIIDEEADRLTELVDGLLDAARVQAGRLRLRPQPVQIESILRRSIERMAGSLGDGHHRVELHAEASPTIVADGARLEQVVVNLLQNAAKYSPGGGLIEVHLGAEAQEVRIGVLDRGVGVPPAELDSIFEPFHRAQNGPAAGVGGAGLGLAICRAIVEAHGGRIWAEARPGGGTAVYLTLPWSAGGSGESRGQT